MVLSLQTLPGSSALTTSFWFSYHHDGLRRGRVSEPHPLRTANNVVVESSFIVYPNPVRGDELHARIVINQSATIDVGIYNLEGERVLSRSFLANPSGTIQTPFDEVINIARFKSGVYLMRLSVKSSGGTDTFVKTFAILR